MLTPVDFDCDREDEWSSRPQGNVVRFLSNCWRTEVVNIQTIEPMTSTVMTLRVFTSTDESVVVSTGPANVVAFLYLKLVVRYVKLQKYIHTELYLPLTFVHQKLFPDAYCFFFKSNGKQRNGYRVVLITNFICRKRNFVNALS